MKQALIALALMTIVTRSLLHNISLFSPERPRLVPFQTVCSVRTMARTVGG